MTNEQQQVKDWMQAFGQETPEKPTIPSLEVRRLRAKLILEEALETINALGLVVYQTNRSGLTRFPLFLDMIDFEHDEVNPNLQEILDGCEDLKVVTEGTLVACGLVVEPEQKLAMEIEGDQYGTYQVPKFKMVYEDPHFNEVMRSNWTKLWTYKEVEEFIKEMPKENGAIIPFNVFKWNGYDFFNKPNGTLRAWLVKDSSGKVIKSPSFSPPNFKL